MLSVILLWAFSCSNGYMRTDVMDTETYDTEIYDDTSEALDNSDNSTGPEHLKTRKIKGLHRYHITFLRIRWVPLPRHVD